MCHRATAVAARDLLASRDPKSLEKLIAMESSALIRAINETVVTQAARYVYGAHDCAISFVEHWLAQSAIARPPVSWIGASKSLLVRRVMQVTVGFDYVLVLEWLTGEEDRTGLSCMRFCRLPGSIRN